MGYILNVCIEEELFKHLLHQELYRAQEAREAGFRGVQKVKTVTKRMIIF